MVECFQINISAVAVLLLPPETFDLHFLQDKNSFATSIFYVYAISNNDNNNTKIIQILCAFFLIFKSVFSVGRFAKSVQ